MNSVAVLIPWRTDMADNDVVRTVEDVGASKDVTQENKVDLSKLKELYESRLGEVKTKAIASGVPMEDVRRCMHKVFDEVGDTLMISVLKDIVTAMLREEYANDEEMAARLEHDAKGGNVYRKLFNSFRKPNKAEGWKYNTTEAQGYVRRHK